MALLARVGIRGQDVFPVTGFCAVSLPNEDGATWKQVGRAEDAYAGRGDPGRYEALVVPWCVHSIFLLRRVSVADTSWAEAFLAKDRHTANVGLWPMCSERMSALRVEHLGRGVEKAS